MKCFNYLRCGSANLSNVKAVLLFCDCLVALCQPCAREQLPHNGHYLNNALICCPKCSYKQYKVVINGENAMKTEEKLVRRALEHTGLHFRVKEDENIKSYIRLQTCWIKMNECFRPKVIIEERLEPSNKDGLRDKAVVKLRYKIARLAKKCFADMHLPYPLDIVSFRKNKVIEHYLDLQVNPVAANKVHELAECNMCCHTILPGESVQLACECKVNLCRNCALFNTAYHKSTYTEGIHCPHCRSSCHALSNIEYTQQCETALLRSAQLYLTRMLVELPATDVAKDASRARFIKALKLYGCLGLNGNINLHDEKEMGRQSNAQLRLEIARLEEMRLNKAGLLNSYTYNGGDAAFSPDRGSTDAYGSFQIGFLHALNVKKNVFFEHLFLHQTAEQVATPSANMKECERKCAQYLPQVQKLVKNTGPLNAFEKIIVAAVYVDKYSNGAAGQHACYNATQVLLLVERYLQNPALQYEPMFGGQLSKDIVAFLRKRFTVEGTAVTMQKLKALGWVQIDMHEDGKEVYAMQYDSVDFAGFEAGLVSSTDRDFYPTGTIVTVASSSSASCAAASGAASGSAADVPAGAGTSPRLASQPAVTVDDDVGDSSDGDGDASSEKDNSDANSGSDSDGSGESGDENSGTQDEEEGSDVEISVQSNDEGSDTAAGASVQTTSLRRKSSVGSVVSPPVVPVSSGVNSKAYDYFDKYLRRPQSSGCSEAAFDTEGAAATEVGDKRKQPETIEVGAPSSVLSTRAHSVANAMPTTKRLRGSQQALAAVAVTAAPAPAPTPAPALRTITADADINSAARNNPTAIIRVTNSAVVKASVSTCTPPKESTPEESPAHDLPSIIHPDLQLKLKASIDAVEAVALRSVRAAEALKADNDRLQQELAHLKEQHAQKETAFEEKRDAQWEHILSLRKELNASAQKASVAAEKWAADGAVLEASVAAKDKQINVHEARIAEMDAQIKGLQGANRTLEDKLAPLALENKKLTNQLSQSQGNYSAARDERNALRNRVQSLQSSNTELKEAAVKVQALEKKLQAQERSMQEERVANDAVQNTFTPLLRENEKLKAEKSDISADRDRFKSYADGMAEELKRTRKQLNDALEAHASLRVEFQETHDELADIKSRKKRDEEDIQKLMFGLGAPSES